MLDLLQDDPTFALGLNSQLTTVARGINAQGLTDPEKITAAVKKATGEGGSIDKFLKSQGIEVNEANRASISQLLLGQMQSQPEAIASALQNVVLTVKDWDGKPIVSTPPAPSTTTASTTNNSSNTFNVTVNGGATAEDGIFVKDAIRKAIADAEREKAERGGPRK